MMQQAADSTFLAPFVAAAREILEKELGGVVQIGQPDIQVSAYTSKDVTTMVGVTGKVQGIVLYGMSEDTAKGVAGTMLGEPCEELNELAQSAIGELGNVITGRATINLVDSGYFVRLSPPILILGNNVLVSTLNLERLVVPLTTKHGHLEIYTALRHNEA